MRIAPPAPEEQRDDEKGQENDAEELGDFDRGASQGGEAEDGGDESED